MGNADTFELPARVSRSAARPPTGDTAEYETLTFEEAEARFDDLPELEAPDEVTVRVYPSMSVEKLHLVADPGEYLIIVIDGDLFVDRELTIWSCEDDDSYLAVQVRGRLSARNLDLGFDPSLEIMEDAEVEDLLHWSGNSRITVAGRLVCRFAIAGGHGGLSAKEIVGLTIGSSHRFQGAKDVLADDAAARVLLPKFVDESSAIESMEVSRALRDGVTVTQ